MRFPVLFERPDDLDDLFLRLSLDRHCVLPVSLTEKHRASRAGGSPFPPADSTCLGRDVRPSLPNPGGPGFRAMTDGGAEMRHRLAGLPLPAPSRLSVGTRHQTTNVELPVPVHSQRLRFPVLAVAATFASMGALTLGPQPYETAQSSLEQVPGS